MPTRSHLTRPRPRQANIDLGDGDYVKLNYDSNRLTTNWLQEGLLRDNDNDPMSLAKALAQVILSWDVTEDDGSPFPPTAENLGTFSIPVQRALMTQLMEASLPTSAEGEGSGGTSSSANGSSSNSQESLQNGPPTSTSPMPLGLPSTS